jgi:large subunit ribosomal protein L25
MEQITLAAEIRQGKGSRKQLSDFRGAFKIPGVIYGGKKGPVNVVLSEKELMAARKKGGLNAILKVNLGSSTETVIVKDLQRHPVTDRPVHADFQRISLTEKITAKVPLQIKGEAPGVKVGGGVLQHELRFVEIRALPTEIPAHIDVDVSSLQMGNAVLVKDLQVPAKIEVLDAADHIICHVTQVKVEEAAAPAAVPGAEGAAAAAAAPVAEPESSSTKGKKDEEGKLIPKAAPAAGAAPEKGKEAKKDSK